MSILVLRFLDFVFPPEEELEPLSLLEYEPPEDELEPLSLLEDESSEDELEPLSLLEDESSEEELEPLSEPEDVSSEDELEPLSEPEDVSSEDELESVSPLEDESSSSCLDFLCFLSLTFSSILDCIASIISSEIFSIPLILSVAPSFKLTSIVLVDDILRLSTVIRLYAFNKSNAKLPVFLVLEESSSPTVTFSSRTILLSISFCITGNLLFNILSVSLSTSYLNSSYFSLFSGFNGLCSAGTIISP